MALTTGRRSGGDLNVDADSGDPAGTGMSRTGVRRGYSELADATVAAAGILVRLRRRWRRLAGRALAVLLIAQLLTWAVLTAVSQVRKRRQPQAGFPRARFEEVEVDGNRVQLYCYGAHLFQDMLD